MQPPETDHRQKERTMSLRERTDVCTCAAVLFGDGEHDDGCPALVAAPAAGPQASGASLLADDITPVVVDMASADGQRTYTVTLEGERSRCTCPDFQYRLSECKHIRALRGRR